MNPIARLRENISGIFNRHPSKSDIPLREDGGGSTSGQITNANIKNFVVKAVGSVDDSLTQDFNSPDSDLSEVREAIKADSYIKLAVTKYAQLIFKAGYHIVSDNDKAAEYVQNRLNMMSFMSGTPMDVIFQEIADDLVAYSNAFLIKSRIDSTNIGGLQAKGVLSDKPVGGYFRVDPTTMQIKVDSSGTIKNYQQEVGNNKKTYKPEDVIHFYVDKEGGALFGTPRIESALEDVKMLRKIEGNVLKLVYRYSTPLMQMKIGIPESGFMATDQEIKDARKEIEKLSDDGIIITNERTEFNTVGAQGTALDASSYLSYFESRVFSALSLSAAMAGRGGAKQDADSMEEQVHDSVKFFQRAIEIFVENGIFNELLLEGGYNPISNAKDKVWFQFEEINLDTKVKMENHAVNMFQGNAIPYEEMRTRLGLRSDVVDESRLYDNMIKQPNLIAQIEAKLGNSTTDGSNNLNSTSGPDKQTKTSGSASNSVQPENQYGKTSANIKESTNKSTLDIKESTTEDNVKDYHKKFKALYKKYNTVRNELCEDTSKAYVALPLMRDAINRLFKDYVSSEAEKGYEKCVHDARKFPEQDARVFSAVLNDRVKKHLTDMFKDIKKKLENAKTPDEKRAAFDSSEYRLRFLADQVTSKSYWYAYVKTAQALKINKVKVNFNTGSEDSKSHEKIIHTDNFSLDDIPAFHPYCKCSLELEKAGE